MQLLLIATPFIIKMSYTYYVPYFLCQHYAQLRPWRLFCAHNWSKICSFYRNHCSPHYLTLEGVLNMDFTHFCSTTHLLSCSQQVSSFNDSLTDLSLLANVVRYEVHCSTIVPPLLNPTCSSSLESQTIRTSYSCSQLKYNITINWKSQHKFRLWALGVGQTLCRVRSDELSCLLTQLFCYYHPPIMPQRGPTRGSTGRVRRSKVIFDIYGDWSDANINACVQNLVQITCYSAVIIQ